MHPMKKMFGFTTRETYLEYKEDWKKLYAAASAEIRQSALAVKAAQQGLAPYSHLYSLHWQDFQRVGTETKNAWGAAEKELYAARNNHDKLKRAAGTLLQERWASKEEAGRQWEEQRIK